MKTAISVPDDVFEKAERLARRLGMSRSQLYSLAVKEFLRSRRPGAITDAMNAVIDEVESPADELVSAAAHRILAKTEW